MDMIARARTHLPLLVGLSALGVALSSFAGCNLAVESDPIPPATSPSVDDAGPAPETPAPVDAGTLDPTEDAGSDACAEGACAPVAFCSTRGDSAFCDDFDGPDALMPGKTKWDFLEPATPAVVTLSTERSASAPVSLLTAVIDADTPGAKFAKTLGKANLVKATWEYDVYFDDIGQRDGFFLDDFQFMGNDEYGFRLVMFTEDDGAGVRELKVEHNRPGDLGGYVIEPPLASGTVELGKWHHFKQTVAFSFAASDEETDTAEFSLWIDGKTTPVFEKTYPAPTRAQVTFARFAGMPFIFNKGNSAGLRIYWDNHTVELE
jgi:hypothetical protein